MKTRVRSYTYIYSTCARKAGFWNEFRKTSYYMKTHVRFYIYTYGTCTRKPRKSCLCYEFRKIVYYMTSAKF